jgi:hypothetical protein
MSLADGFPPADCFPVADSDGSDPASLLRWRGRGRAADVVAGELDFMLRDFDSSRGLALLLGVAALAVGFLSGFAFTSMQLSASDSLLSDGILAVGKGRAATKFARGKSQRNWNLNAAANADKTARYRLVAGTCS